MQSLLVRIDDFLIDHAAQPAVDAAARILGLTRRTLARTFLALVCASASVKIVDPNHTIAVSLVSPIVIGFLVTLGLGYDFHLLRPIKDTPSDARPRYRHAFRPQRLWVLILLVVPKYPPQGLTFFDAQLAWYLLATFTFAAFLVLAYVPACDPGPPRKPLSLPRLSGLLPRPQPAGSAA